MIGAMVIASGPIAAIAAYLSGEIDVALIIEDGTGKSDANTWASLDEFKNYFLYQPRSVTSYTDDAIESRLVAAAIILSHRYRWCGKKTVKTQALAWPRTGAYDQDRESVGSNDIPPYLKFAQIELAYWLLVNTGKTGFESDTDQASSEFKEIEIFEGIRVEYKDSGKFKPLPSLISELVQPCGRLAGTIATYFIERS